MSCLTVVPWFVHRVHLLQWPNCKSIYYISSKLDLNLHQIKQSSCYSNFRIRPWASRPPARVSAIYWHSSCFDSVCSNERNRDPPSSIAHSRRTGQSNRPYTKVRHEASMTSNNYPLFNFIEERQVQLSSGSRMATTPTFVGMISWWISLNKRWLSSAACLMAVLGWLISSQPVWIFC